MARFDLSILDKAGRSRERKSGLGDVVSRVLQDAQAKLFPLFGRAVRTDQHAVPAGFTDCFNDEILQVIADVLAWCIFGHQERFDVVQDGIFAEVILDDARDVGINRLIVGDAGTEGVGKDDVAGAIGGEQSRRGRRGDQGNRRRHDGR